MTAEAHKKAAAEAAVGLIDSGMTLGLGTGSTAALVVRELARKLRDGSLRDVRGVPTSNETAQLAGELGVPLASLEDVEGIDITLDGADEVDPGWNVIKGGGGCLLREKIVAQSSRRLAIVVDESKLVEQLGRRFPLPIEVIPFGWSSHERTIRQLGGDPKLRLDDAREPFRTDEGNYVLDVRFSDEALADPGQLHDRLRARAGIVETGFFLGMTAVVVVGSEQGAQIRLSP